MAATLMAASARTAPKTRGVDSLESLIIDGEDLEELARAMERKATEKPEYLSVSFARDAGNVRDSDCVLLLGVKGHPKKIDIPLNCGACGFDSCEQLSKAKKRTRDLTGPGCIFQMIDLGIALGSAVKIASDLNIDNRIMYTAGTAAKQLGLLDSDVVIAIVLSVRSKNPYFDRK